MAIKKKQKKLYKNRILTPIVEAKTKKMITLVIIGQVDHEISAYTDTHTHTHTHTHTIKNIKNTSHQRML